MSLILGLAMRDRVTREQRSRVAMPVDHQVMEFDQLVLEYHAGGLPGRVDASGVRGVRAGDQPAAA